MNTLPISTLVLCILSTGGFLSLSLSISLASVILLLEFHGVDRSMC